MGNITRIKRYNDNNWDIDDLMLDYQGNQVKAINDNSEPSASYDVKEYNDLGFAQVEFKYDGNGNLISDLDRKIATIRYNLLNLPDTIQFENGNQIVNTYDASGRKLKTQYFTVREPSIVALGEVLNLTYVPNVVDESGTVYDGQFEHSYNMGGPIFGGQRRVRIVHNPEGYTTRTETTQNIWHVYNYYRRDHLGNNCAVWDATNDTTLQQTVYYASGLPMAVSSGQSTQPYKYNGKEFIEMHGYDTYDYGFRGYYPAVGRFATVDPLAEKYYSISPYVYCENNPMRYIDLYGLGSEDYMWDQYDEDMMVYLDEVVCIAQMPQDMFSWSDLEPIQFDWSDFQSVRDGDENDDENDNQGQGGWSKRIDIGFDHSDKTNDFIDATAKTLGTYGLTSTMTNSAKTIARYTGPIGAGIDVAQVGLGYYKDGYKFGYNTQKAVAGSVGGMAGAWVGLRAGAWAGFNIGWQVGLFFEGVGAIPGAVIGGIVGGIGGAYGGAYGGSKLGESLINK